MADDTFDITISLPSDLAEVFATPEAAAAFAHRSVVLELLRAAEISQGTAARLLAISRWELLDLMTTHDILSGPETPEEVDEEIAVARRRMQESRIRASD